jgi:outer membrane scaffolding protein for murein synthesis (MipA/OmpV family)
MPSSISMLRAAVSVAACASAACTATAKELPRWELGAGIAPVYLPDYRGSDEYRGYLLPLPYVVYRGDRVKLDRRGATGILFETDRLELDLSANITNPARSSKNRAREGMPDLDPTLEFGPKLRLTLMQDAARERRLTLELPVRAAFALDFPRVNGIGTVIDPFVNLDLRNVRGSGWNIGVNAGPVFADRRYHRYYYEVEPQFARADRPAYSARAGYSGTQFTIGVSKRFKSAWFGAFVRAHALSGAAFEDSPIVRSRTAVLAGFGIAYVFAVSRETVDAEE